MIESKLAHARQLLLRGGLRGHHGDISSEASARVPPVIQVVATENRLVADLAATIDLFVDWSERTGRRVERGRERAYAQIMRALTTRLLAPYLRAPGADQWPATLSAWIERIAEGKASPVEAAQALLGGTENNGSRHARMGCWLRQGRPLQTLLTRRL